MGVFSRTMLMLTLAWLVGLIVAFTFMSNTDESTWREKYVAEANIRRAIAYRIVDLEGGIVAERGFPNVPEGNSGLTAESLGGAPYGLPDAQGSAGSTEALPGARVPTSASLIETERGRLSSEQSGANEAKTAIKAEIDALSGRIAEAQRNRRAQQARLTEVRDETAQFAVQMDAFRTVIAQHQQQVFNLDYDIHRVLIEKDALTAELAQVLNDTRRIDSQSMTLEDSYYEISKAYERTIRVLAWYEQTDPNLRTMADTTGRGWLRGRVVAVGDDPRTGVVSISIGSHEGVQVGQMFTIYRNDRFIGRMVVDNVRPNVSVGRLVEEFRGRVFVAEGDSVKTAEAFGGATLRK